MAASLDVGLSTQLLRVRDASGGLNVRDAAIALELNESPDALNVTLDERGGVGKRLGYIKENPTPFGAAGEKAKNGHFAEGLGIKVTQVGASLYKDNGTVTFKTFTTNARCGFAEFLSTGSTAPKLFFLHPIDGLFYYDGTTVTAVADVDAPKGDVLFVWQNKLYAAGNPTVGARVAWSAAADGTAWAAADFNDLREKDGEKVVALEGAAGESTATGEQGLLAFKRESAYRIVSSVTGEYETIDAAIGAASALSVVSIGGRAIALSEHGIFWTDGLRPMREASERLRPLFTAGRLNLAQLELFCAGTIDGRAHFSIVEAGETKTTLAFEYHPQQQWIVAGTNAMSFYVTYGKDTTRLLGGSPTVDGQVYWLNKGGSDDGVAITSRWQCRWFEPADGMLSSLLRLRLLARTEGQATLTIRKDYAAVGGDNRTLQIDLAAPKYNTGLKYDAGHKYGAAKLQNYGDFFSLGTCKSFSLIVTETSSLVGTGTQYLGRGNAPEVGAWAVYGFDALHVPLGTA